MIEPLLGMIGLVSLVIFIYKVEMFGSNKVVKTNYSDPPSRLTDDISSMIRFIFKRIDISKKIRNTGILLLLVSMWCAALGANMIGSDVWLAGLSGIIIIYIFQPVYYYMISQGN